ncbi:CusA/CzcA family heavy metal efflux RND transporter, partial [Escherichia coli]|nr:CusA/CzcA family heavy metal efflux RND transporter [Escherichia coli]
MIEWIIRRSVANRFLVMMGALFLSIWGTWTIINTPVDALPDLSDVQVIIKTSYPGQAPQIVENQVTYPLTTTMLSVPGAKTVRGFSQFGDSYVYVIFEDGTDLYWARSRVLEYLNQVQGKLPAGVSSEIGPDATGVGWIFEYALVDRSGKHDLSELRSLQDWFLKFELKTIPNVAEVASVGGVVKQYQIQVNPVKLSQYGISLPEVKQALESSNQEAGGSSVEMAEAEYMVRASGYLQSIDDFNNIVLKTGENGVPVYLRDVARVQTGPEMRRGIAELNGQGEVAGGVVILRSGKNARDVITAVRDKLETLKASLPEGVEIVTTYDRSQLIDRAIDNLSSKLLEEFIVVAIVCALFLWHVRSALVAIISLPLGLCIAFIVMHFQGLNANIMSLGGIAIAVGAMVDAAIVMIENAHKRLEEWDHQHPGEQIDNATRWKVITDASVEVGPALFISLLIITLSFIPIFTLEGQEGRLFGPLAFTKTYSMAGAAALAIIVIPILMGFWIRGKIPAETSNPLNRVLIKAYHPLLLRVLHWPKTTLLVAALSIFTVIWPLSQVGGEFLPKINEGDLLYRSISRRVAVTPEQGKSKHVIITVATDTGYHTLFMDKLSTWLFWFNIGLVFISVFLGWLTTRIGLKPLREMTSLASSMTVHSLDQRLNPDLAPPEISETMQEFNNMFDRLEGAFRKLSDFSSDIAHELRTPVSNLMMQTQFALAKERDVSHYREILFANLEEL